MPGPGDQHHHGPSTNAQPDNERVRPGGGFPTVRNVDHRSVHTQNR